jgi:hypothetical protein
MTSFRSNPMTPAALALCQLAFIAGATTAQVPTFTRAYPLKPEEGVFAYSRISPDGRYLAYASQARDPRATRGVPMTVTLVDLQNRQVLFTERGLDAYWSTDGERMIYSSNTDGTVSIRHLSGEITRNVAPMGLGDYYSWGMRDGRNLILTIQSNYYYLDGDKGVLPASRVPSCPVIGTGERPLLSRDGQKITTFVRGTVVVRSLTDCSYIFDTGLQGAKADFSWDSRYIAFHVPKGPGESYDIVVVDLQQKKVRNVTSSLKGSSFFPNWTRDGRLSFRYDGDDYRGFMFASNVLSVPAQPLSANAQSLPVKRTWFDLFPETARPKQKFDVVLIWATWSAHSPLALRDLQQASQYWAANGSDVAVMNTTDPASKPLDVAQMLADAQVTVPSIPLAGGRLRLTEAANQMPTTLLFRDGQLIDHKLGAQTAGQLEAWVAAVPTAARKGD